MRLPSSKARHLLSNFMVADKMEQANVDDRSSPDGDRHQKRALNPGSIL